MKTKLLTLVFFIFSLTSFSQTIWTGAGDNINWDDTDNWNTNALPTNTDDVFIPGGFTVTLNIGVQIKSLDLQGNSVLNITSALFLSDPSTFGANTTVNWANASINGTLLLSLGTMNLITTSDKSLEGSIIMNNSGTINIIGDGDLFLRDGSILNNQASGIIDMQADGGNIDELGGVTPILNNAGLILRTTTTGEARIIVELNNNGGIIQVESGSLFLRGFRDKNLTGGIYNVAPGTILDWNSSISLSGVLAGIIDGDLNWNNIASVPVSATLNFTGSGSFNWIGATLNGGGVLTNQSTLNLITVVGTSIQEDTTLNNSGTINIVNTGDLIIQGGSIVNNQTSGVIDLQADGGNIRRAGGPLSTLNNIGLLKRTTTAGEAQISVDLNNNDGIIQVESGILSFISTSGSLAKNLTGGTYSVFLGAVLDWDGSIVLSGVLSGTIDGTLNWDNFGSNTVSVPGSATLNFTGSGNVNWVTGTLNGGGILTNQSILNLITNGGKAILEDTTLNNYGTINIVDTGDLFIIQGLLNNQASGVIDMQANEGSISTGSGGASHILNNIGLIKRTTTTGIARIFVELNNSGTIEVETGELEIGNSQSFTNEVNGIIKGVGIFDLPTAANYTNDGIFAPGLSPGILTVQGDYKSTTNSVLDIELNGLIQGTEYDLLAITGDADFDGDVQITLGFDADVNDEFIVANTTNTINTCNLPTTTTSSFGGFNYEFDILCRNNNELVLTVTNETLGLDSFDEEIEALKLFPNPATDLVSFSDETINKIEVYDINGRQVLSAESNTISVKSLAKGIYIIKAKNTNGIIVSKKLIKN